MKNMGKISNDKLQLMAHRYILKTFYNDKKFLQLHLFWLFNSSTDAGEGANVVHKFSSELK